MDDPYLPTVLLAYGLVAGCILVFLWLAARRHRHLGTDLGFARRRLDAME